MPYFASDYRYICAMKEINYREISKILAGKPEIIRANRIPKKYSEALKELEYIIEYWKSKHNVQG